MKNIEFVCTGNRGRSPVAELLAKNYLQKLGEKDYSAKSSGVLVEAARGGKVPLVFQKGVVELALKRNLYDSHDIGLYRLAEKENDEMVIDLFYQRTVELFGHEEETFREDTLKKFSIKGIVKEIQEQTIPMINTSAVFGMTNKHVDQINTIYQDFQKPLIANLASYVSGNDADEIANAFGKPLADYERAVEQLVSIVPRAIEMYFSE